LNAAQSRAGAGWTLAIGASAAFGLAGSFATPLIHHGWTAGAVVSARVTIAFLVLLAPALRALKGRWHLVRQNAWLIISYGVVAVAACQLTYFQALATLDVGVALLLEYLGIIMVVAWLWVRHGQRPRALTLLGSAASMAGLVLVLNLVGGGVRVDAIGMLWGLAAAVGLATHYVLSARPAYGLPPLALAAGGLGIGAVAMWAAAITRVMPMRAAWSDVPLASTSVPWWVPILGVSIISAAIAYVAAIGASRALGSKLASFAGLAEVLFAIVFAWLLLGQLPGLVQLAGGALIIGGVLLVRADETHGPTDIPDDARARRHDPARTGRHAPSRPPARARAAARERSVSG
jgi:drug/metabolite transporter (DMT)-like permease